MKTYISILLSFIFFVCISCSKSTLNGTGVFNGLGKPDKIEYFLKIPHQPIQNSDSIAFVITDEKELENAMLQLKNADNPQPWKGAGWNEISIHFKDKTVTLMTDGYKVGTGSSGQFYFLEQDNFISEKKIEN